MKENHHVPSYSSIIHFEEHLSLRSLSARTREEYVRYVRKLACRLLRHATFMVRRRGYFESCRGRAEATADTFNHLPPRLAQPDVTEFFIKISLPRIKARASTW